MYNAMSLRAGLGTARRTSHIVRPTVRPSSDRGKELRFLRHPPREGKFFKFGNAADCDGGRPRERGVHVVQHWQHLLDVDKGSARNRYGHRRRRRPFGDCRQSSRRTFGQFCSRCLRSDAVEARRSNGSCKLLSCIATIARTDGMQVTDLLANFGRCDVWRIGGTIQKERPQNFRIPYPTLCAFN